MLTSFQVLDWHLSLSDQNYRCCGDSYVPCFPTSDLPHFQINGVISSREIILASTGNAVVPPGSTANTVLSIITETKDGETYSSFIGDTAMFQGLYYYKIVVGGVTYYSDAFKLKSADCFSHKFTWTNCSSSAICYDGAFDNVLYLDKTKMAAPTYDPIINGKENGNGGFTATYTKLQKYDNLFFIGVCHVANALKGMAFHDNIILSHLESGTDIGIQNVSVTDPSSDCYFPITVTYKSGDALESEGCCGSIFDDSSFEDNCETTTDPGEPCPADFVATLLEDGNGNVVATASGAPGTITAYNLYVNGQPSGQGQSMNLTTFGTYEVRIVSEGCTAIATYIYQDPCVNFSVELECTGLKIDGIITGVPTGDTATVSICDESGLSVGSSFPFTADEAGAYIVKVETAGGCSFISQKQLGEDVCDWEFTLGKSSTGALVPEWATECEDPTYNWFQITEANNRVSVGSGSTYTPTETGYYILQVSCEGCVKEAGYMCTVVTEPECIEVIIKEMPKVEIEGTVEVEGTVEIDGIVKICDTTDTDAGPDVTKTIPPKE